MTIKEIAKLAGVSISTVSKIMNNKDESISAETREHVLRIAKDYNYKPYASVISPRNKSLIIGVLVRNTSEINASISGILASASRLGYAILLRDSSCSSENERKNIFFLLNAHVDGIIWEPVSEENLTFIEHFKKALVPFILMNATCDSSSNINYKKMGYFATEALIQKYHVDIACIPGNGMYASAFYDGYQQCLFDHHLALNEDLIFRDTNHIPMSRISEHMFSGIVIFHYKDALRFYQSAAIRHYRVPYDFSIVSLQEPDATCSDYPPISTLTIPYTEFGKKLTEHLINMIEKKETDVTFDFPCALNNEQFIEIPYSLKSKTVISLGSINIDNYLNFETLPHTGKAVTSDTSSVYVGGKCTNEGIGVAKLGHKVSLIGRVGNDADADKIYETIKNYQIDSFGLKRSKGHRTGQAYIFVQNDGDSMISMMSGANNAVTEQDIIENERQFMHASYCLMQTEVPIPALIKACEFSKKYNVTTVLKPSACTNIPEVLFNHTDIIVPNLDELNEICPEPSSMEEKAQFLLSYGIKTVIVTLGAQGCYIKNKYTECHIPAVPFVSIDSSGAGDAFISALVSYLLYDYDVVSSAKIASFAAGFSTTKQGTVPALIDKSTLESLIRQTEPELLRKQEL